MSEKCPEVERLSPDRIRQIHELRDTMLKYIVDVVPEIDGQIREKKLLTKLIEAADCYIEYMAANRPGLEDLHILIPDRAEPQTQMVDIVETPPQSVEYA